MTEYIIDAYAWIEYLEGTHAGETVEKIIEECECFTSAVTLAEVVSKAERSGKNSRIAFEAVTRNSRILPVGEETAYEAAIIHAKEKAKDKTFGLADAFILAQRGKKQKILTGDPHFKGKDNVEFLE